jgi:hypothetical protein
MRHDEVNQEADDHHLSCSCPCSRHRGAKSLKHQVTEAPKHCRSASCSCRCLLTVNRSVNHCNSNSSRRLFGASKTAQGRCLVPRASCLEPRTAAVPRTGDSVPQTDGASVLRRFGASNRGKGKRGGGIGLLVNLVVPHLADTILDYTSISTMPQRCHNDATMIPQQFHMLPHWQACLSHLNGP